MVARLGTLGLTCCLILAGVAADACAEFSAEMSASVAPSSISDSLFDEAVLVEVNRVRCNAGLAKLLGGTASLRAVSRGHSNWMARNGKLSHSGGRETGRTFSQRLRLAGQTGVAGSENIAVLPRYRFGQKPFTVHDRRACLFSSGNGPSIPPHSYSSLAKAVVTLWMDSPPHRRNILDRNARTMVAAVAFSNDRTCGKFWVTQVFTD